MTMSASISDSPISYAHNQLSNGLGLQKMVLHYVNGWRYEEHRLAHLATHTQKEQVHPSEMILHKSSPKKFQDYCLIAENIHDFGLFNSILLLS